jgi:long-subunit fatty acid transport protein
MMDRRIGFGLFFFALVISLSATANAQLEVNGGFTHLTGDFGLNGFNGAAGWQFKPQVELTVDTDFVWNTSKTGVFDLAPTTGEFIIKSNLQNYMGGGRVDLVGWKALQGLKKKKLLPFAELLFGWSRLGQSLASSTGVVSFSGSDGAYTYTFGGGVDYRLGDQWFARGRLDWERTHFDSAAQNRARLSIAIGHYFGSH